ncbi:uncharacterized protein J8A68_002558 [[Candida] subhashii]|uniref:GRIP domain-containing protein n=1 Tax=[Candida] subhashii TaxID=561895 RepID=A0A8J5UNX8_9ASCO|nr:uncharacterized protein J8A68_002558 [[Candida] subhashii]KAG7663931.1 hypothetical protein J8A68_002558 [[Candida] subhashii]
MTKHKKKSHNIPHPPSESDDIVDHINTTHEDVEAIPTDPITPVEVEVEAEVEEEGATRAEPEAEDEEEVQVVANEPREELIEDSKPIEHNNGYDIAELQAQISSLTLNTTDLTEQLRQTEIERDEIQQSYDNLLSRISSMKTIFSKMKQSEIELDEKTELVEQLSAENESLKLQVEELSKNAQQAEIVAELQEQNTDLNNECERLSDSLTKSRREYHATIEELQDEKYNLENQNSKLSKKINELNSELNDLKIIESEINVENKTYITTIDELKEKLELKDNELQEANNTIDKLNSVISETQTSSKDTISSLQQEIETLNTKISDQSTLNNTLASEISTKDQQLAELQQEIKQIDELKVEINNKQLVIGKLRHEAIILNEHLTKALTMLKQGGDGTNKSIDRELISNVIISFLQFPRGDTKKFEALQLISALLEWDQSQKIAAGLQNTSNSKGGPQSDNGNPSKQSFVSLWTDYLERESSSK